MYFTLNNLNRFGGLTRKNLEILLRNDRTRADIEGSKSNVAMNALATQSQEALVRCFVGWVGVGFIVLGLTNDLLDIGEIDVNAADETNDEEESNLSEPDPFHMAHQG